MSLRNPKLLITAIFSLILSSIAAVAQPVDNDEVPNYFTYRSVIPHGCIGEIPSARSAPADEDLAFDQVVQVSDQGQSAEIRVRAWRLGCHEQGRSAIILNFDYLSGSTQVRYPRVRFSDGNDREEPAGLFFSTPLVAQDEEGESLDEASSQALGFPDGVSFIVAPPDSVTPGYYNGHLTLDLEWGDGQTLGIPVPSYDPFLDLPQSPDPAIHGRYSGQWVASGLPRSGLVLQIAEIDPSRNYVFAVWFTYLDGAPVWLVGNADIEQGATEVTLEMLLLEGGGFVTEPGSFSPDDVTTEVVGTMTLRAIHCNRIQADLDFSAAGLGVESLHLNRLIRIAGYDCDQTQ